MWRLDFVLDGSTEWTPLLPAMESREVVENAALLLWLEDTDVSHVRVVEDAKHRLNAPYLRGSEHEDYLVHKFHRPQEVA